MGSARSLDLFGFLAICLTLSLMCSSSKVSAEEKRQKERSQPTLLQKLFGRWASAGTESTGAGMALDTPEVPEKGLHESLSANYIHHGVGCDQCGQYPIIGERFKCLPNTLYPPPPP